MYIPQESEKTLYLVSIEDGKVLTDVFHYTSSDMVNDTTFLRYDNEANDWVAQMPVSDGVFIPFDGFKTTLKAARDAALEDWFDTKEKGAKALAEAERNIFLIYEAFDFEDDWKVKK